MMKSAHVTFDEAGREMGVMMKCAKAHMVDDGSLVLSLYDGSIVAAFAKGVWKSVTLLDEGGNA